MSTANQLPEITLDELERLIRMLGMMGSASDSEALVAARFAVKWVREHDTDWKTLLTPPEEPLPVTGVATVADDQAKQDAMAKAHEADRVQAYANGYQAGLRAMAQQVKAQASYAQAAPQQPAASNWSNFNPYVAGLGAGLGGSGAQRTYRQAGAAQAAQAAPGGLGGGAAAAPGKVWPTGSWQQVCQDLLDRHAQGIPGVLRAREEQFVQDVLARGFPTLTQAQDKWLRDIAGRNGLTW